MNSETVLLIVAIISLATSAGLTVWLIAKHSRRADDELQTALWRSEQYARSQWQSKSSLDARAYALAEMAAANDQTDADATDYG